MFQKCYSAFGKECFTVMSYDHEVAFKPETEAKFRMPGYLQKISQSCMIAEQPDKHPKCFTRIFDSWIFTNGHLPKIKHAVKSCLDWQTR